MRKMLSTILLVLCTILLVVIIRQIMYTNKLEDENRELREELETLQVDSDKEQEEILNQIQDAINTEDFKKAVEIYTIYKDKLTNSTIYKEAKVLFDKAVEKINDSGVVDDIKNEANKIKDDILESLN